MDANAFVLNYWKFFKGLEQDLLSTQRYVSFEPDNYGTFSVEYNRLYQAVCSEVDVLAKQLCELLGKNTGNITEYYHPIVSAFPCILNETVTVQGLGEFQPWKEWTAPKGPEWWKLYNMVKHRRTEICSSDFPRWKEKPYYKAATLQNVLLAMAGLYVLEFYALLLICHRDCDPKADEARSEYNQLVNVLNNQMFRLHRWDGCCWKSLFGGAEYINKRVIEQLIEEHKVCFSGYGEVKK
ncbi:MAG: hypothetical protein IKJ26_08215 [Clostridia bacterium]|nr:hypothetical protein [Clostridia bacterium]